MSVCAHKRSGGELLAALDRVGLEAQLCVDGESIQTAFRYDDEYVRQDGRWTFAPGIRP